MSIATQTGAGRRAIAWTCIRRPGIPPSYLDTYLPTDYGGSMLPFTGLRVYSEAAASQRSHRAFTGETDG